MKFHSYRTIRHLLALLLAFLTACAPALAQEKKVHNRMGWNSKMGAYRALAQHIYATSRKATWQRPR